jgi:hypothetical protein
MILEKSLTFLLILRSGATLNTRSYLDRQRRSNKVSRENRKLAKALDFSLRRAKTDSARKRRVRGKITNQSKSLEK